MHKFALEETLPSARQAPVLGHALHTAALEPLKVPTAQEKPAPVMAVPEDTVWVGDTAYVPAPPVPELKAVMVVPAAIPAPVSAMPT